MTEEITLQKFYEAFVGFARMTSARFKALETRFDALEARFDKFEISVNERFDQVNLRFDTLEHLSEVHETRLDALTTAVTGMREDISTMSTRLMAVESKMATKQDMILLEDRMEKKIEEEVQELARIAYRSITRTGEHA